MPARHDPYDVQLGRELQQHGRGEQLRMLDRRGRRVRHQPPVQPSRDRTESGIVDHGLAEGPEQRRHRADRRQPVPLDVPDQCPHPVRPGSYVVQVAADQRAVLRRPVEARAAHRTHPFRHRWEDRELGRLRHRPYADQLRVPPLADPGDHHAEYADGGHRGQVRAPGVGDTERVDPQQQEDDAGEGRGPGRPVREGGHRGQTGQEEPELRARGDRLGQDQHDQGGRGRDPGPARRWLAAQPARLLTSPSHSSTLVRGPGPRTPDRPAGWPRTSRAATVGA